MIAVDPTSEWSKRGFSLIEIALALFVVAIGVVGILALFPVGLTASRDAVDDSQVSILAESVLMDLRMEMAYDFNHTNRTYRYDVQTNTTYSYALNSSNTIQSNGSEVLIADETGNFPIGTFQLTITPVANTSNLLAEATLVCWPGKQRIRKLTYYTRFLDADGGT